MCVHARGRGRTEGRGGHRRLTRVGAAQAHKALSATDMDKLDLQQAVHATELALAQSRLRMAEAEARAQTLEQQNQALRAELDDEKKRPNPLKWFGKK